MNYLNELSYYAKQYDYQVKECFDRVYIHTHFENWYFEINRAGYIKLFHQNSRLQTDQYHFQFRKKICMYNLIEYIHHHEFYRYSPHSPLYFAIPI